MNHQIKFDEFEEKTAPNIQRKREKLVEPTENQIFLIKINKRKKKYENIVNETSVD